MSRPAAPGTGSGCRGNGCRTAAHFEPPERRASARIRSRTLRRRVIPETTPASRTPIGLSRPSAVMIVSRTASSAVIRSPRPSSGTTAGHGRPAPRVDWSHDTVCSGPMMEAAASAMFLLPDCRRWIIEEEPVWFHHITVPHGWPSLVGARSVGRRGTLATVTGATRRSESLRPFGARGILSPARGHQPTGGSAERPSLPRSTPPFPDRPTSLLRHDCIRSRSKAGMQGRRRLPLLRHRTQSISTSLQAVFSSCSRDDLHVSWVRRSRRTSAMSTIAL